MRTNIILLSILLPMAGSVACGDNNNSGTTGLAAVDAGSPDGSSRADVNVIPDLPSADAPDAAVCDQLASAARAQFESYLQTTSSLSCQVDSDCSDLSLESWNCFAACGQLVRTADVTTVTAATSSACDKYFGAGCPAITPPCPYPHAFCDHGTCAKGFGPGGLPGGTDASVDAGGGVVPTDGGNPRDAKDYAKDGEATANLDGGACTWPAKFTSTSDGSAVGCWAHAISGPVDASQITCSSAEYALGCVGEWPYSADGGYVHTTVPEPDTSLGCRILPIPTTVNTSFYCCPCG